MALLIREEARDRTHGAVRRVGPTAGGCGCRWTATVAGSSTCGAAIDGWWSPLELPPRALEPDADYGFMLDDDPHALPRPALAPAARRRPRAVAHLRPRDLRLDRRGAGPGGSWRARWSTSSTSAPSPPRAPSTRAIERLDHLRSIGVDLVELMPVNAFNGTHNWGYDGVDWFAVTEEYGGPPAYQRFVDACHAAGLGVVQDVVYNHLGPSGNYLPLFGPYLKQGRNTWGDLVNLDGEGSAEVRRFILDNVRMWFDDYHVDALRLDAVHALVDTSPVHLLEEMAIETQALSAHLRPAADADRGVRPQRRRLVTPREGGGYGLDAQWSDDFHHALHVALTGETTGYYADFEPLSALAKVCSKGFFHDGTWSSFRGSDHGVPIDTEHLPTWRLVVCSQNHDQIGNRARGDRLTEHLDEDQLACAALLTLCGPFTPMLFMGEEWAASTPFQFFTSHPEEELGQGDRRGPDRGVRADGLGPGGRARPAGPGDLRALEAGLVGARERRARRAARRLPSPGRTAPLAARADRPRLRRPGRRGRRGRRGCSRCGGRTCCWR